MMKYMGPKTQYHFDNNLRDWLAGGPTPKGWTRTGPKLPPLSYKLASHYRREIPVNETLGKNPEETERWHISFLKQHDEPTSTAYFQEYLKPRYGPKAVGRAETFLRLFEDIKRDGIRKPVWLADFTGLGFGFRYFRFEGCHRICCAKVLGLETVPAYVFTVRV